MSILLAMGIPTTTDDSGYFLWFAHNWTMCVVPALTFGALLSYWVTRKIRTRAARTPGSSDPPGTQSQAAELHDRPNPPPGSNQTVFRQPYVLSDYPGFGTGSYSGT
jgi:hypothetical protein